MAFIAEQAGGLASTGTQRVLDVVRIFERVAQRATFLLPVAQRPGLPGRPRHGALDAGKAVEHNTDDGNEQLPSASRLSQIHFSDKIDGMSPHHAAENRSLRA